MFPNTMYTIQYGKAGWIHAATWPSGEVFQAQTPDHAVIGEYRTLAAAKAALTRAASEPRLLVPNGI